MDVGKAPAGGADRSLVSAVLALSFFGWLSVAIAGPFVLSGTGWAEAVVGLGVALPFTAAIFTGALWQVFGPRVWLVSGLFVVTTGISTILGVINFLTVVAIAVLPVYLLTSGAMTLVSSRDILLSLRALAVFTAIALVAAAAAHGELKFFYGQYAAWQRLTGGQQPNYYGLVALVGMICALAWRGAVKLALVGLFFWLAYLAQSRMTLICMFICVVFIAFEAGQKIKEIGIKNPGRAMVLVGLLTAGAAGFAIFAFLKLAYISSLGGRDVSELGGRGQIWKAAIAKFAEAPWFGFGYRAQSNVNLIGPYYSHNMWLSSLLEIGAIGTFVFMTVYIYAFYISFKHTKRCGVAKLCVVILSVYLVYGIFEGRYINTGNSLSVLFLFSLGYLLALEDRSSIEHDSLEKSPGMKVDRGRPSV